MASTSHRGNSFDILRICAALAVIVCHHYYISGREGPSWMSNATVMKTSISPPQNATPLSSTNRHMPPARIAGHWVATQRSAREP